MFRITASFLALALFLTTFSGCKTKSEYGPCTKRSDCLGSDICFFGQCQNDTSALTTIYAVVTPPTNSGLSAEHIIRPFDLAENDYLNIDLSPQLSGAVHIGGLSAGSAHLTAKRSIPNLPYNLNYHLISDGVSDSHFNYSVTPGDYQLTIIPLNRQLPVYIKEIHFDGSSLTPILYPYDHLVYYHGTVQWESGSYSPISGAELAAKTADGRSCGTSYTGADGSYTLDCWDGSSLAFLNIRQGVQNPLVPYLEKTLKSSDLQNLEIKNVTISDKLPLNYKLSGQVLNSSGNPLNGATVILTETLGLASYRTSATTQKEGKLTLNAWGEQLAIVTAFAPGYSRAVTALLLPKDGSAEGFNLILEPALTLSGMVTDEQGKTPLANAMITAYPLESDQGVELLNESSQTVITDEVGQYVLKLGQGDYYLEIVPKPAAIFPRERHFIRLVKNTYHHIYMPKGHITEGQVTMAGQPLAEAKIEIYSTTLRRGGKPEIIGRAVSNSDGYFVLVLPSY